MTTPNDTPSSSSTDSTPTKAKLTFWQTLVSVLYAMLGVQGKKNAQASLEEGHIGMFIFVGLLVVGCFILIVSLVTYLALSSG